jgi:DNA adenine methylase
MKAVLKYPGSKWRIVENLVELIPPHHTYLEPYFGSGAVFFRKAPSDIETINDLDYDVVNLFQCIREDSEKLARLVMATPYSRQMYDDSFKIDLVTEMLLGGDRFHKACQFLVRCWMGHGFRTNGYKVGWKNDVQGRERMYALWNWYRIPEWIIEVAERLRMVQIECSPALELIQRYNYENVFMYLDPPYLLDTRNGKQYRHEMTDDDHKKMLKEILASRAKIMISGYASALYNDMLSGWTKKEFQSHAEMGKKRTEVVWMNYEPVKQMELELIK